MWDSVVVGQGFDKDRLNSRQGTLAKRCGHRIVDSFHIRSLHVLGEACKSCNAECHRQFGVAGSGCQRIDCLRPRLAIFRAQITQEQHCVDLHREFNSLISGQLGHSIEHSFVYIVLSFLKSDIGDEPLTNASPDPLDCGPIVFQP